MARFRFNKYVATQGAVTGKQYAGFVGVEVNAPAKEFDHVHRSVIQRIDNAKVGKLQASGDGSDEQPGS